jgi:predicted nucleotidyltransferase
MPIQLSNSDLAFIKSTLTENLPNATYYVFGSRAKGTAKPSSDLDTVIVSTEKIPLDLLSALNEIFSESNLLFKVDIIDWHRISDEFQKKIRSEWIEI